MDANTCTTKVVRKARWPRAFLFAATFAAFSLAGCGGDDDPAVGTTTPPPSSTTTGKAAVLLGDAAGDFYSYTATLTSLKLVPASGDPVETLTAPVRVDLTQLQDLSELLAVAEVPTGTYESVRVTLDFSDASIIASDTDGTPETLQAVDAGGSPLSTLVLTINPASPLVITEDDTLPIAFDFDIASSSFSDGAGHVVVLPTITTTTTPDADRVHGLGGQLTAIDGNTLTVRLRPAGMAAGNLGEAEVTVSDATVYEIDGNSSTGTPGLTALGGLTLPTPVAVFGTLGDNGVFTASRINAGSSVAGADRDTVVGTVIARSDNTATVLGSIRDHDGGARSFSDAITVDLSDVQSVTAGDVHAGETLSLADVSVGSRIAVLGACNGACSGGNVGASRVQLFPSRADGAVIFNTDAAEDAYMEVNVADINGIPVDRFDFTNTSVDPGLAAKPFDYYVSTTGLTLGMLDPGTQVRVYGFTAPFATDNPKDFIAYDVTKAADIPARMLVSWTAPGSSAALAEGAEGSLTFDMADPGLGQLHHVYRDAEAIDLTMAGSNPTVSQGAEFQGCVVYDISDNALTQYDSYAAFVTAVNTALGASGKLRGFAARGGYDGTSNVVSASTCGAVLQ